MWIVKARKVEIVALKKHEAKILDYLQKSESFSVIDSKKDFWCNEHASHDFERVKWETEFCISFLNSNVTNKKWFKYVFLWDKELMSQEEVKQIALQYDFQSDIKSCKKLEKKLNEIRSKKSEINKEINLLHRFESLNFDLNITNRLETSDIFIWEIKKIKFSLLQDEIEKISNLLEIVLINKSKTNVSFAIIYTKDIKNEITSIISQFWVLEFKDYKKYTNISEYYNNTSAELNELNKSEISLKGDAVALANSLPKLKACHDYFTWQCDIRKTANLATYTDSVFVITWWMAWDKFEEEWKKLNEITRNNIEIINLKKEEWEKTPIEIRNKSIFKPFEVVTALYWLPKENEFDPTPFISIFFWIFFAFCLTDFVYWLIIFIWSLLALKFMFIPKEKKPFIQLMAFVWFSTTIMWILFWWYAGLQSEEVNLIPSFMMNLQQFDMIKWMEIVMWLAFWLWFIHLLLWTIIKWVHSWKEWKKWSALCMNFSWILFFILIWLEVYLGIKDLYIWITVVLMAISLSYDTKWFMKILAWPFNILNESISWGSNILSYARLFALWISTWIIAIVFNQIALTLWWMLPPVISHIVIIFIILFWHTLNIAMNWLWAFIHSARLQFVEFYWKFMEWWWLALNPLKRKSTYVYLTN